MPAPGAFRLAEQKVSALIIVPVFPPDCSDLAAEVGELGGELVRRGMAVTVATWEAPGRTDADCPGIHVVSLPRQGEVDGLPAWVVVIRRLVGSGLFSTCILFADPADVLPWGLMGATISASTKLLVRLLLDQDVSEKVLREKEVRQRLVEILRQASAVLLLTRNGPDRQFLDSEKISGTYLPHAFPKVRPARNFREQYRISKEAFVILLPGDFGLAKNQLGLIQALRGIGDDWKIVFASPSPLGEAATVLEKRFAAELSGQSNLLYLPGLDREGMAAAIEACDVLVCASPWEYAPREPVAAMALGRPWLAEKGCFFPADLAGGVSARLVDFRETLNALRARPDFLARLGAAGHSHWRHSCSWESVMPAWMELVASGKTNTAFPVPADLQNEKAELDLEIQEAVLADRNSFVNSFVRKPEGLSYCIITDGREPDKLRLEIDSIRAQGVTNSEILLGGAVPEGFADVRCFDMQNAASGGRLGFMRNRLVEQTRFSVVVVADDDMVFHPGFAQGIAAHPEDYDVLCVRILNTDGTRFWDWAVYGSPTGHHLIDYDTIDPFVYVTGGMCVMRSYVPDLVQWSDSLGFYQFEDIEFSRKINAQGLRIRFCEDCVVTHNDERYYGNNYQVGKKTDPPLPRPPQSSFLLPSDF